MLIYHTVPVYPERHKMIKTKEWAGSLEINTQETLPPSENDSENHVRTAGEVAIRTIILHSIVAAGSGIDRNRITGWLQDQNLWEYASPHEQSILLLPRVFREDRSGVQWLQEAQWALLWTIKKVKTLGLPVKTCDGIRLVDEIMPVLGGDIDEFISAAEFRPAVEINAENDRINRLYYHAQKAVDREEEMPEDMIYGVLYHRYYAFRWLTVDEPWDDINMGIDTLNFD